MGKIIAICALLFLGLKALTQPATLLSKKIEFEQLPVELGISQRSINVVMQDSDGYLWIGTWSGLIRYDGNKSEYFVAETFNDNSLRSNKITSLSEDESGNIWVGTRAHGVFIYNKTEQVFYSYTDSLGLQDYSNSWDIEHRQDGTVWLATETGLVKVQNGKPSIYTTAAGLSDNFITSLYSDRQGNLWATSENGLNRVQYKDGLEVEKYFFEEDTENRDLHNYFYECESVSFGGEEILYISSKRGMKELRNGKLTNYEIDHPNAGFNLFRSLITIQADKPLVLIGSEMGLNAFSVNRKSFEGFYGNYDKQANLSHNTVTEIYMDQSEVLWVGTKRGINKFDSYDKGFKLYRSEIYDPTGSIVTGIAGTEDQVFISTMGNGIFLFDPIAETFQKIRIKTDAGNDFSDFTQKITTDHSGKMYLGTAGDGIYSFDPKTDIKGGTVVKSSNFKKGEGLTDNYIMSVTESQEGGVWVGTWSGGLNKISDDGSVDYFGEEMLLQTPIVDIHESNGLLWLGTRGRGVIRYNIESGELRNAIVFTTESGRISSDFISDIFQDTHGRIWVGTEEGLNLYRSDCNCFETFKKEDGLYTNEVISILEDQSGKLWLANWSGISLVDFSDDKIMHVEQFDRSDRLQGDFFYNAVAFKDEGGSLYFGGSNGFNVIDTKEIFKNPHAPKTQLTSLFIFNKQVLPGEEFNNRVVLKTRIEETDKITLEYDENSISIEFASLHFAASDKNRYRYKLEGFDQDWKDTDQTRPFASYTNLHEGEYEFKVVSSNNDRLWEDEPQSLEIIILPPWWKTPYAYFGLAVCFGLLLLGFRYIVISQATYKSSLEMERMKRENLKANNRAKLKFFTNISHEFRTPLTLISGPVESLINDESTGKFARQHLTIIRNNTNRLLRLVNQLLDFRKVEAGNMKLNAAEGNFVKFIKEIKLSFETQAELSNIKLDLFASSNVINLHFDRDQFEKIVYNLLSNAFKHTPKGGQIVIKVIEHQDVVDLFIEDNGSGIPKESFDKILNRFYSSDDHNYNGTGIGLALVNSLVKLHHAELKFHSIQNENTTFRVTIKKGRDHFGDDELISDFKNSEFVENYETVALEEEEAPENRDISEFESILIVEDNDEVRSFIKSIFISSYIVLEATNGEEGLEIAQEEIPDLIISDVMMPVMDGIKLCKHIKTNQKTSHIPVILLTARTSLIFKADGYESGADDYISKPFESNILKMRVKNLIKQRQKLRELYESGQVLEIEPSLVSYTSADELFIKSALESVEQNMSNSEYTVEDLGRAVGMSRMQLYRKLKSMLGQSANEFIRTIRLKRAAQLLQADEFSISEVTYKCGFSDLQYFRQCFKKQFGMNPSEFLQQQDQSEVNPKV